MTETIVLPRLAPDSPLPKYRQIKEAIAQRIKSEEYKPGQIIPPENELSTIFQANRNTVIRAMNELKNEGLIDRIQGVGTFVAENAGRRVTTDHLVGLLVRSQGHLFSILANQLLRNLQKRDYYAIVIDPREYQNAQDGAKKVKILLDSRPAGMIIDGEAEAPFAWFLDRAEEIRNLVFFNRFEFPDEPTFRDAHFVLSDFTEGGYIVAKHLLGLGHRRIGFLTYTTPDLGPHSILTPNQQVHQDLLRGFEKAIAEEGLTMQDTLDIIFDQVQGFENLERSLTAPDRPTAIMAFGDYRAKSIFQAAQKLGLRIPKDLAVVGYNNTPWVEMLDVPLTSVSLREEVLAETAVAVLTKGSEGHPSVKRKVFVKPQLVIRESCGGKECRP